jgi:gas vesicle protein GvpN
MYTKAANILEPQAGTDFVETPYIRELADRAVDYLRVGFPVHFTGPAGIGKTTLALHVAARLGRSAVLICGDHEFGSSDLVGGLNGYRRKYTKDNFIRSVLKTDETMAPQWIDNRLTIACQYGLTLVYDEYTRSRPEANNILLSVLEEGILPFPTARGGENYLKVHPDFNAIFTSNPEEYAGVYRGQDALRDRMVAIRLGNFDEDTEVAITQAKANISAEKARRVVNLVRRVREAKSNSHTPTVRACIVIGKMLRLMNGDSAPGDNHNFRQICQDILLPDVPGEEQGRINRVIDDAITTDF